MLNLIILILLVIVAIALLTKGADFLVNGSADLARYLKVQPILIGLTIVSLGTSLPEFIVSLIAVLTGSADISIGNIIGSNISNIGLIIGIAALIYPLAVRIKTLSHEFPFLIIASFLFVILSNNKYIYNSPGYSLHFLDGVVFLIIFVFFLHYIFRSIKNDKENAIIKVSKKHAHKNSLWKNITYIIVGIPMLIGGGRLFVYASVDIARYFGVSEAFIGLTLVAIGTSLPELFTSAVAAMKKEVDIAVGNIVGSNIFNILFVLGLTSMIKTIPVNPALIYIDAVIMIFFTLLLIGFATTGKKITRIEGLILLLSYVCYIVFLFSSI